MKNFTIIKITSFQLNLSVIRFGEWIALVNENSLTVHIRKIREKIEENPSKPQYLKTAKGLGYKLLS